MFHILETRPTKMCWCWLAREYGTSTLSPLASTVLVLRVAIRGGWRNSVSCGTPCTCALWNTTNAATSLQCSSESRGLADSGWDVGSAASTSRPASWCARMHTTSTRGHHTLSKAVSGPYRALSRKPAILRRTVTLWEAFWAMCLMWPSNCSSQSTSTPRILTVSWSGRGTPLNHSFPLTASLAAGNREITIACVFSGAKVTC